MGYSPIQITDPTSAATPVVNTVFDAFNLLAVDTVADSDTPYTDGWFFKPPFPAAPLFWAIVATQVVAALMCGFGLLVPAIPWKLIGWVWVYLIAWLFILGGVRMIYDRFASYRTARHLKSVELINQSLQPHVPAA